MPDVPVAPPYLSAPVGSWCHYAFMVEIALALVGAAVPLALAVIYRLPRRTLRLEKEVGILTQLEPGTDIQGRFKAHVERLLEREIEENETSLQLYDLYTWTGLVAYSVVLGVVGAHYGGTGWVLFGIAILLLILLGGVAGMKLRQLSGRPHGRFSFSIGRRRGAL